MHMHAHAHCTRMPVQEDAAIHVDMAHEIFHNANKTSDRDLLEQGTPPHGSATPIGCGAYFVSFPFGNAEDREGWAKRVQRDALFHVLGMFTGDK